MIFAILLSGIWDTILDFTFRDMRYCDQYFGYFQVYWIFRKINYGYICLFMTDIWQFTWRNMGYFVPPSIYKPHYLPFENALYIMCSRVGWNGIVIHGRMGGRGRGDGWGWRCVCVFVCVFISGEQGNKGQILWGKGKQRYYLGTGHTRKQVFDFLESGKQANLFHGNMSLPPRPPVRFSIVSG